MIAMYAAGPPEAVVPSLRKNQASSSRGTCLFPETDSGDQRLALQPCVAPRLSANHPSRDHVPTPTSSRKMRPSNMLTSVRALCSVPHNPFFANVTILVEYMATAISMRSGTVADRVTTPINSRELQTISTTPTNGAMTCGEGMPIFTKRPTPRESGSKNFCMPSERKTQPTRTRISRSPSMCDPPKMHLRSLSLLFPCETREVGNEINLGSNVVKQGHEAKVHVQLLMAVEQT